MKRIVTVIAIILLSGCASIDQEASWTQEQYYREAKKELDGERYTSALQLYNALQARFPYSVYASQANLDSAYAHFKLKDRVQAIAECDRFIQMQPTHPNVDYAYYLKGLAQEVNLDGLLTNLGRQDMAERDPEATRAAFFAFKDLINRFPGSIYVADARRRMDKLSAYLAQGELHAARYYLKRGAPLAAANRSKSMLEKFPLTPAREEALAIMMAAYDRLGETVLRDDARRVLQLNYPESEYLENFDAQLPQPWWAFWR